MEGGNPSYYRRRVQPGKKYKWFGRFQNVKGSYCTLKLVAWSIQQDSCCYCVFWIKGANCFYQILRVNVLLKLGIWSCYLEEWGSMKPANSRRLQTISNIFRKITNASFVASNFTLHSDLRAPFV